MADLLADHLVLACCVGMALVSSFWLAVLAWDAPLIEDGDSRFYGES